MKEDIQREFAHVCEKLEDADFRQKKFTEKLHEQSVNDITDVQEAYSDIIFNDINDELGI